MYVRVQVIAGAKKERVVKVSSDTYTISVKQPAQRNLANLRIREILGSLYTCPYKSVKIVSGHRSPRKIFDIQEVD